MKGGSYGLLVAGVLIVVAAMWFLRKTALLRDQLVPQLPPDQRTYSLAKTQMAFWSLIILECFLYAVCGKGADLSSEIVNAQALQLMGISLLTAGGAAVVEAKQDSPEDKLNAALRAVGINSIADVRQLENDAQSAGDAAAKANAQTKLDSYRAAVAGFRTEGFWADLVSNINGVGLHRLQAAAWTVVIGALFIWKMAAGDGAHLPALDPNLLAVMGISSAGYVGFKINEQHY
jgi:hypothetical protein